MSDTIVVAPEGRTWIIKHNDGVIGHVSGREEAKRLADGLVDWLRDQGRAAELRVLDDPR